MRRLRTRGLQDKGEFDMFRHCSKITFSSSVSIFVFRSHFSKYTYFKYHHNRIRTVNVTLAIQGLAMTVSQNIQLGSLWHVTW